MNIIYPTIQALKVHNHRTFIHTDMQGYGIPKTTFLKAVGADDV
jgi:hypothetical protein